MIPIKFLHITIYLIIFPSFLPNRFTDSIKLKGIIVVGGEDGYHPNKMRMWVQRRLETFQYFHSKECLKKILLLWLLKYVCCGRRGWTRDDTACWNMRHLWVVTYYKLWQVLITTSVGVQTRYANSFSTFFYCDIFPLLILVIFLICYPFLWHLLTAYLLIQTVMLIKMVVIL